MHQAKKKDQSYRRHFPDEAPWFSIAIVCVIWAVGSGWLAFYSSERWYVHLIALFGLTGTSVGAFVATKEGIYWWLFVLFNRQAVGTTVGTLNSHTGYIGVHNTIDILVIDGQRRFHLLIDRRFYSKRDYKLGQSRQVRYVWFRPSIAMVSTDKVYGDRFGHRIDPKDEA